VGLRIIAFRQVFLRECVVRYAVAFVIVLCGTLGSLVPAEARRVALVIGNAKYEHIAGLPNVPNDAKAMEALFKAAKFDSVVVLHDKRVAELRRELLNFAERAAASDVAVLFYAGHGIEMDGVSYLVPIDARLKSDLAVKDETISLDRVLELMAPARKLRVVILDACRENPFAKSMKLTAPTRSVTRGLGRVEADGANTLIAFATQPKTVAEDGPGLNSPFTTALVKHLATPGLDLRIALGNVRDEVMAATGGKQSPYVTSSLGGGVNPLVPGVLSASTAPPPPLPQAKQTEQSHAPKKAQGPMEIWLKIFFFFCLASSSYFGARLVVGAFKGYPDSGWMYRVLGLGATRILLFLIGLPMFLFGLFFMLAMFLYT
jgi:hypothetical protein